MFVKANCIICGRDETKTLYRLKEHYKKYRLDGNELFNIVKCIKCGLVYVNPRLSDERLRDTYTVCLNNPEDSKYKKTDKSKELYYQNQIIRIEKVLKDRGIPKPAIPRVLDFGCGWGHFLRIAKGLGWEVSGVELEAKRANEANRQGLSVFNGTLKEAKFPDNFFDVITAFQVLEHLTDPSEILDALWLKLKDRGIIVVSVPNYGSLEAKILRRRWQGFHPVEHIYYFDFRSLKKILEKNRFTMIKKPYMSKFAKAKNLKECTVNWLARSISLSENLFEFYPRGLTVFAQKIDGQ